MIGYGDQALYVLSLACCAEAAALSVWPALRPLFGRLAYPAAYTVSLLLLLLGSFYLGLVRLPTWLAIVPFLLLLGAGIARRQYGRAAWEGVAEVGSRLPPILPVRARAPVLQPVRLALLRAVHGPRLGRLDHAEPDRDTARPLVCRRDPEHLLLPRSLVDGPARADRRGPRPGRLQPGPPDGLRALGRQLLPDRPPPARALPLAPARAARSRQPDGHRPARHGHGAHPGSRPLPPCDPERPDGVPALLDDPRRSARARDGHDQPALPDRAAGLRLDALVRTFVPAAMGADGALRPRSGRCRASTPGTSWSMRHSWSSWVSCSGGATGRTTAPLRGRPFSTRSSSRLSGSACTFPTCSQSSPARSTACCRFWFPPNPSRSC